MPSVRRPSRLTASLDDAVSHSEWEFREAETRSLTHGLHRYSGKFIPQIARQLVELTSREGDVVLDPYCGSGTTLVEAELVGRQAIGIDINPLATIISAAKSSPIDPQLLREHFQILRSRLGGVDQGSELDLFVRELEPIEDPRLRDPWFLKWYQPNVLRQLVQIDRQIQSIEVESVRRAAWIAFSDILRRSSNAHSGYPNVMFDARVPTRTLPLAVFIRRLNEVQNALVDLYSAVLDCSKFTPVVIRADASRIPLATSSVDAIVTHPPYIASIPYAEYQQLSLRWLGYNHNRLDAVLTGGRRQSRTVVESFQTAFAENIREFARVVRKGGLMSMLLGDPTVRGKKIALTEMATALAEEHGFRLVTQHRRIGMNRRANLMSEETLLFFEHRKGRVS